MFSLILIKAKESPASTTFFVESCQIPMGDGSTIYLVTRGCDRDIFRFCADASVNPPNGLWYDTKKEHCEGADGVVGWVGAGSERYNDDCCSEGTVCKTMGAGCVEMSVVCTSINTQSECESEGCLWFGGKCVHLASIKSCSDYGADQQTCNADPVKIGNGTYRTGLGTEICGRTLGEYMVPIESCKCSFDVANNRCVFSYSTKTVVGGQDYIECKKSYLLTDCTLGKQTLSWDAAIAPPEKAGEAAAQEQCAGGEKQISCGSAIEKIPFFSFWNLIIAAVIILLVYIIVTFLSSKRNVKGRKRLRKNRRG